MGPAGVLLRTPTGRVAPADPAATAFHRSLAGYAPTPLHSLPGLAAELGLGAVELKDESDRFGLPAFKVLGASWAVWRRLTALLAVDADPSDGWAPLRASVRATGALTLVAATEGNHGRAVAWVARQLGLDATIYVPSSASATTVATITGEGATLVTVDGDYDDAVVAARSSSAADPGNVLIADVAHDSEDPVPGWVIDGYATLFAELDDQRGGAAWDALFVPAGVGALTAAAVRYVHHHSPATRVVAVEPRGAACVLASLRQGRVVSLPAVAPSAMAGLNCGTPSTAAWPDLLAGVSGVVAVTDDRARQAQELLARAGVAVGTTGAAAAAGLLALLLGPDGDRSRSTLGLGRGARVLLLGTESA